MIVLKRSIRLKNLINLEKYPVINVLKYLLKDKTTKQNIIFATDAYTDSNIDEKTQITEDILMGFDALAIQPRVLKSAEEQSERTRKKAEVFTPSWICNKMNNHCDEEWFGRPNVFNREEEHTWITNKEPVQFENAKDWQKYVDSKRLEITCGEAPYIVSRYDAATGEIIPVQDRIGILDRKIRIVNENTDSEKEWLIWVIRAYQSVYGYEFQGDNLLIARINLLNTFVDYMQYKWNRIPTDDEIRKIANIIVWNFWQMDGITGSVPFCKEEVPKYNVTLFDCTSDESFKIESDDKEESQPVFCRIFDWRNTKQSILYNDIKKG